MAYAEELSLQEEEILVRCYPQEEERGEYVREAAQLSSGKL
jgi:hypothetical protein